MTTKYFCDICKKEVANKNDLTLLAFVVKEEPANIGYITTSMPTIYIKKDIAEACAECQQVIETRILEAKA